MNWLALALAFLPIDDPLAVFPAAPPAVVVVDQTPQPQPIDKLAADEVLVLALPQRIALVSVPEGLVEIEETQQEPGASIIIRSRFAGGKGAVERRKFEAPFIYEITAKSTGSVELIAVPIGLTDPTQIQRQRITLTAGGALPDVPTPVTPPKPVGPVATELRVLLLLDQSDSVEAQAAASAVPVLQWLDANCTQADGRAEWRRWDRSAVEASLAGAPPIFEKLYKEIRPKLPDGPQAVIARGAEVSIVEIRDREQLLAALKTAKGQ